MHKLVVIAEDLRSIYNVGSLFRTCDAAKVDKLFLTGRSAHPPHPRLVKTALGSHQTVPWEYHLTSSEIIPILKAEGYTILGMEYTSSSTSLFALDLPEACCLVLGNEVTGLSQDVLSLADTICHIPMLGTKSSLNVSVAAGVAIYQYRKRDL